MGDRRAILCAVEDFGLRASSTAWKNWVTEFEATAYLQRRRRIMWAEAVRELRQDEDLLAPFWRDER